MFSIASKISFSRRSLSFGVIVIISITTSIILFANVEAREHYSHWIISITASVTAILAISILFQQKRYHDLIERADLALAIALGLSLSAEILWAIYEIILDRRVTSSLFGRRIISICLCLTGILCLFNLFSIFSAIPIYLRAYDCSYNCKCDLSQLYNYTDSEFGRSFIY